MYFLLLHSIRHLSKHLLLVSTNARWLLSSGIKSEVFHQEFTIDGTKKLIEQVAKALGNTDYQKLNDKIDADVKQIQPIAKKPKVLFIYARGNMLMVAGKNTPWLI